MGDIKGFLKYERALPTVQPVESRLKHYDEFVKDTPEEHNTQQAARCMDCGIPFCHSGCPISNNIPDFNDAVYKEDWYGAYQILSQTNNFPEFTGRICPAPCEASCVLNIDQAPVTIEHIEKSIIETAFHNGWVKAFIPSQRNGKKIAIIGSGPAGLTCADQLNKEGHSVDVYERDDKCGGLLRYGIPDFKLEKSIVDRRLEVMRESGINFITNTNVGIDITVEELKTKYDAIVLCGGSTIARDLDIPGHHLRGIYPAMQYLTQSNRYVAGEKLDDQITAKSKRVIVIGGGDTGSDCIGTANRQGAASVHQIELMSKPPQTLNEETPWPQWPMILRTSTSHQEGADRSWSVLTNEYVTEDGQHVSGLHVIDVEWTKDSNGKYSMMPKPGTERVLPCDLVFIAIGFTHPQQEGLLSQLGVSLDARGNVSTTDYKTSVDKVYAAGDMRRGQSLVVWAINEGRAAAARVHKDLCGQSHVNDENINQLLMV